LVANHVIAKVAILSARISITTDTLREVEHESNRQAVVFPGEGDQRFPRFRLHIRGVNNREPPGSKALPGDKVQNLERIVRSGLVVFVVRYESAAEVRGDHLGRLEERSRKSVRARAFAQELTCPTRMGRQG